MDDKVEDRGVNLIIFLHCNLSLHIKSSRQTLKKKEWVESLMDDEMEDGGDADLDDRDDHDDHDDDHDDLDDVHDDHDDDHDDLEKERKG